MQQHRLTFSISPTSPPLFRYVALLQHPRPSHFQQRRRDDEIKLGGLDGPKSRLTLRAVT